MTRDYARKPRATPARKPRPKSQVPAWVWLFTGSVLGAFIMFLVYLAGMTPDVPTQPAAVATNAAPETQAPSEETRTIPKPRFDFYKLLQESEVIVPATEPTAHATDPVQPLEPAFEYILQVGSFRRANDADNLRAQLILLNLDARTEAVTIRNGEHWHRVLVGPFDNQSKLAQARSILVSNQYNALVLKRKPDNT
ncbi:MAG TPA: SPOR domain-containing protein [Cellvibrionaceae bacterium]